MWYGNHERRNRRATFVRVDGQPEVRLARMGFHADLGGGYGSPCLGERYDVLAKGAPAWQAEVLAAAAAEEMPLRARQIGKAGKYRFWVLTAATAAEAQAESLALREEQRQAAEARRVEELRGRCVPVPAGAAVFLAADESEVPAVAFTLGCRHAALGLPTPAVWIGVDDAVHDEGIDGLILMKADGSIRRAKDLRDPIDKERFW